MTLRLDASARDFEKSFTALLAMKRESAPDVDEAARKIIAEVILRGDAALIDFSRQFDRIDLENTGIAISAEEIEAAEARCSKEQLDALDLALARIMAFHERQMPEDLRFRDEAGVELGWRWTPIESVGLYVPGGTAAYPSSVLMNVAPAKVAGVERIVMVVPTPDGHVEPLVLAAAKLAGVDESLPRRRRAGRRGARPMAQRRSRRSSRSSGRATPMSPPPSAASSARSAST